MSLAPGTRIGPYEVLAPLGAGGMGEVWRARDVRLGREVAIKGLPAAFARDVDRLGRFEREAKLLASLNHPNIASLYGLEELDGTPFLVLELVEGESLSQRLARGAVPVRETIELLAPIAAAMAAAHERGIVHRDLKPANVMIGPSRTIKVLDFGLARGGAFEGATSTPDFAASATVAGGTAAGLVLGTTGYMSPEQARGQVVDRRTDVWAFGCIAFECLSGQPAFAGGTPSDVIGRILEREPEWNALPAGVPPRLRELVRRCLTKDAESRPRDIGDLGREIAAIGRELSQASGVGASSFAMTPSLAVLYFENLAKDPENEYFCAGITEDILTDLSKIKGLRVASRNAVARYRGQTIEPARVAQELGVAAVLEGSVRRAGDRVRITVQLVNATDGFQLWAERYDRTLEDVFAVQEEIAASIAKALAVALTPSEAAKIAQAKPDDVRAYDLYLKGRERYGHYTAASLAEALELFQQAIALDPGYARAWAGAADCYGQMVQWGGTLDRDELVRRGLEAARKAIELAPQLPDGYKAEALALRFSGDLDMARASLRKAVEADPRYTPALINLGVDAYSIADLAGAERFSRRVLEIDPQEAFAMTWLATIMMGTGRFDETLRLAERIRAATTDPFYGVAADTLELGSHVQRGDLDMAGRVLERLRQEGNPGISVRGYEALLAVMAGRTVEAGRLLDELGGAPGLGVGGFISLAATAVRLGRPEVAVDLMTRPLMADLASTEVRLVSSLYSLADLPPFAPRKWDVTLVWPLEAPMIDRARFKLFREVKIESGLPEGTDVR